MGYQIVWSPEAVEDVDVIAASIARDSVSYAAAVVQKILTVTRDLSHSPGAGDPAPEFGQDEIRSQFAYSYRIIYQIQGETVTILAIVHGKRLLTQDF